MILTMLITMQSLFNMLLVESNNQIITRILFIATLSIAPCSVSADFAIKKPCGSDAAITENLGKVYKFYASMLAFNNEKPRCLLDESILSLQHVNEAIISNHPQTNDVIVELQLSEQGKELFAEYSTQYPNQEVALLVEQKILAMFTLIEPITNGIIKIYGLWYEDAIRLSNAVNQK